jgi:hypothetical protein
MNRISSAIKNPDILSDIYWLGTVPAGVIGSIYLGSQGLNEMKNSCKNRINRIQYGAMMGVCGFGAGVTTWLLWPITLPAFIGSYTYDKYYTKN